MRAARLLRILLLLQNRGRLTCATLARELEVTRRTVLRDVDALTEAGLPVIVHRGPQGGIELGFNYRTRLTGLAADEAEALAVVLAQPPTLAADLGMTDAAARAIAKLVESFPDQVRERIAMARAQFRLGTSASMPADPRIAALADAVRGRKNVRLRASEPGAQTVQPLALVYGADGWSIADGLSAGAAIPIADWGDINISARRF